MKTKYIHYCWFGNKPLPKLTKKCIKSWKKYLPDYEIICWNETNVNLNECAFIKEAYENKKWAFVADYTRAKVLNEKGGIYFDTDMLITRPIDFLMENETFLGLEDSKMINAAVWGTTKAKTYLASELLKYYKNLNGFDKDNIYSFSIPKVLTKILKDLNVDRDSEKKQVLDHDIAVYPRDYFYPLSFDYKDNYFTSNTCMVHYFKASWFSEKEKLKISLNRIFGEKTVDKVNNVVKLIKIKMLTFIKKYFYKQAKYIKFSLVERNKYQNSLNDTINALTKIKSNYIVLHNPEWLGITSATLELFDNTIPCGEFYRKKDMYKIGNKILSLKIEQVIFSAMCIGWNDLCIFLKKHNPSIKIKVYWHGSLSQVCDMYAWKRNLEIMDLNKKELIDVIGICKESLIDFYQKNNFKVQMIYNKVTITKADFIEKSEKLRIGLYAAKKDDWIKNVFNQIAAISLLKDATIDIIPLDYELKNISEKLGLKVTGISTSIERKELINRMATNTINIYVTYSECAPMLPLESLETGTLCIFGNNNHYFDNSLLKEYLIVNDESNPIEIVQKINKALENKELILREYKKWARTNNEKSKRSIEEFLEI